MTSRSIVQPQQELVAFGRAAGAGTEYEGLGWPSGAVLPWTVEAKQRMTQAEMRAIVFKAKCRCGRVELEAQGPPIVHIACYCDDCQRAAEIIDALDGGSSGCGNDGGTENVLFRRDRVRFVRGAELIASYRVRDDSPTTRLVASCCNTAMTQRHDNWWPHRGVKTCLFEMPPVPLEMRVFTRYAPAPQLIPDDVPCSRGVPIRMGLRLLRAKLQVRGRGRTAP